MKNLILLSALLLLTVSSCLPASSGEVQPVFTPISEADLQGTAAVISRQTLQAIPTQTALPSETAVLAAASPTATLPTPTLTENPALLTLTATLLAGTPMTGTQIATQGTAATSAATSAGNNSNSGGTAQPLFYGTLPPALPSGTISLFNKSDVEVYISLRCVTKDGNVSILEYPVKKNNNVTAPAGSYTYIAWVGGRQFDGGFKLEQEGFVNITFFKNRIDIKKK